MCSITFFGLQSGSSPESEDDREEEQKEEKIKKPSKVQIVKNKDTKMKHRDPDYIITPDNYFMMHSSKKVISICFKEDYKKVRPQ